MEVVLLGLLGDQGDVMVIHAATIINSSLDQEYWTATGEF
jgi:hypothetical protein